MKAISRILPLALAASFAAAAALPAAAQYSTEFTPAKLVKQGSTSKDIAGSGTVVVQVQVNPDGSHKVVKVIKSSNSGDNDAAMDIAQNSSYHPAHRGKTPVPSFYDFTLKFVGKSVASAEQIAGADSPQAQAIAALIAAGKFEQAKTQAQAAMAAAPSAEIASLLGVADAQTSDFQGAAQAFDRAGTITKQFHLVAAQSYANSAVALAASNPTQALAYGQKAVALDPSTNSQYALGVAQLSNKQYAEAIATLKGVHDKMFADPKTTKSVKVAIDSSLLSAYTQNGDSANAQAMAAEIKGIDPTSTLPARVLGNALLADGVAAVTAKNYPAALQDFDEAGAQGDSEVAVTADTQAALVITRTDNPDYAKMQAYADKALAIKPDDPAANFAEGIALTGEWAKSHDDTTKKKALDALNKADQLAKAAGNEQLALTIESFIKTNLNSKPAAPPPDGNR
ncbi:MAG TPA: energy transducer TonB [Verrucomicrobiae bacterium]|nr:energy transducer TonB [Verrucomicrobiae bacterium]